jgi:hypothetical protein
LQPFLTPDDAQAIDKYLAHITTIRSDIVTKPWLIDDMVILGLQHGVEFLTILETSFPIHADATRNELRGASSTHLDSKGVIGEIIERTQEHVNSVTVLLKTIEQEE